MLVSVPSFTSLIDYGIVLCRSFIIDTCFIVCDLLEVVVWGGDTKWPQTKLFVRKKTKEQTLSSK